MLRFAASIRSVVGIGLVEMFHERFGRQPDLAMLLLM